MEHRIDTDLVLGRHTEVVPELTSLVREHPFRERFHAQLMIALYRSGRQVDALTVYRRLQRVLAAELGLEPQPELTDLHAAMLRGQVPDAVRGDTTAIPALTHLVPSQLPPDATGFTGRAASWTSSTASGERATGRRRSSSRRSAGPPASARPRWPCTGRTGSATGSPTASCTSTCAASTRPARPMRARPRRCAASWTRSGCRRSASRPSLDAQAALYRSLLAGRRMLVVLDNARDAEQVRPLLPGAPGCLVVVTSRNQLTGLVAAPTVRAVDPGRARRATEARELLDPRLGADRVTPSRRRDEIIGALRRLPLALAIVAARAAVRRPALSAIAAWRARVSAMRLWTRWTTDAQAACAPYSPGRTGAERSAARHVRPPRPAPGHDIGGGRGGRAGRPAQQRDGVLASALERQSLINQPVPGRWQLHDLVSLYAAEEARRAGVDERAALRRLVDHYNHTALRRGSAAESGPARAAPGYACAGCRPAPAGRSRWRIALVRRRARRDTGSAAGRVRPRLGAAAWQLARSLDTFYWRRHRNHDRFAVWRVGVAAADRLADPSTERGLPACTATRASGSTAMTKAWRSLDRALRLGEQHDDDADVMLTLTALSHACAVRGDHQAALGHAQRSLALARRLGEPVKEADRLNAVGWYTMLLGRTEQARRYLEEALTLVRGHGHLDTEVSALDSLAALAARTGRHAEALGRYEETLPLFVQLGDDHYLARRGSTSATCRPRWAAPSPPARRGNERWLCSTNSTGWPPQSRSGSASTPSSAESCQYGAQGTNRRDHERFWQARVTEQEAGALRAERVRASQRRHHQTVLPERHRQVGVVGIRGPGHGEVQPCFGVQRPVAGGRN